MLLALWVSREIKSGCLGAAIPPVSQEPGILKSQFSPLNCWALPLPSSSVLSAGPPCDFVLQFTIFGFAWFWVETRLRSMV